MILSSVDNIISYILIVVFIVGVSSTDTIFIDTVCDFPKFRPDMKEDFILNWNGSDPGPNGCRITFEHQGFSVCFKKRTFYLQRSGIFLRYHANDSDFVDHSKTYTYGDTHDEEFCGKDDNQVVVELYAIEDPGNPGHRIDTSLSYFSLTVSGHPVDFELIIALVAAVPILLLLPVAIIWVYRNKQRICERIGFAPRPSQTSQQLQLTDLSPQTASQSNSPPKRAPTVLPNRKSTSDLTTKRTTAWLSNRTGSLFLHS